MKKPSRPSQDQEETVPAVQLSSHPARPATSPFPIVGIGASAGGLEALEQFLGSVPEGSGMAYVVIQHLDPTHQGIMPELLQRHTSMEVHQVKDRMRARPDCVYVIPPNRDMSILHGVLHLFKPMAPRGLRLPIDFFFRSLADDRRERAIGVILSGMGSDGTIGLRAIKERAGLVLVQEPGTAHYDGMPRSAIDAGVADIVAPAEQIPGRITAYLQHLPLIAKPSVALEDREQSALEKITILLRAHTGHDFSSYKKSTVYRRIERRMGIHQVDKIASYVRFLQQNPQELELLFKELLIGVTGFFRDPAAWEELKDEIIPNLLANRQPCTTIRVWSAGCSTGEEAYSLAMVFKEAIAKIQPEGGWTLQVFATDLDQDAIDKARQGLYPTNIAADVSPQRLSRFFVIDDGGYRVGKEIREAVVFATQNLIKDPPFTKLDLLICRNLLIYLSPDMQKKLLPLFHYCLNPGGILFLGNAETIGSYTDLFILIKQKSRIYRRLESFAQAEPVTFPSSFLPELPGVTKELKMPKPAANLTSLADQLVLRQFAPSAVLVNSQGDILYISGRTGAYLEPAAGSANWNVFAMAREGLRFELGSAFQKVLRSKEPVIQRGIRVTSNNTGRIVDLTIQPILEPEELRGMVMIIFSEAQLPPEPKASGRAGSARANAIHVREMEQELLRSREELRVTREEMQTSQEELKSTNEELQSTNEELQSTNEELTTSKEELQSLNEELQTVNAEQGARMDELLRLNNDMKNLLNSTDIATIFLDSQLHIRRFTTMTSRLFKLIPSDVGRPLTDIVNDLLYPELGDDAQEVLRTLVFSEKQVATHEGRWYTVRIMPYRTMEDMIDGVVMTFTDITAAKTIEAELRAETGRLRGLIEQRGEGGKG